MAPIPDTGRLEEISFPRLLADLYHARFDGRVELGRQRVEHTFLFAAGAAVGCESIANKNGLCDQLVAAGAIAEKDRDRAISLVESKGCKEASAILELELLDPRGLVLALRDQVRIHLLECIGWPKGAFSLDAGAPPTEAANPFRIDVYDVLQAGIETHWRADQVLLDLEPKVARFAAANDRFEATLERLESDDALAAFVQALDGKQALWDALKLATTPRSLAAAWVLDATGALDYSMESEAADSIAPPEIEILFTDSVNAKSPEPTATPSAPDAGPKPVESEAAAALRNEITLQFEKLEDLDFYQLLSVDAKAKTAEIKASYLRAAKRYHPDALAKAGLDGETRQHANNVFARISKAYSVLTNKTQRTEYDEAQNSTDGADRCGPARQRGIPLSQGRGVAAIGKLRGGDRVPAPRCRSLAGRIRLLRCTGLGALPKVALRTGTRARTARARGRACAQECDRHPSTRPSRGARR